MYLEHSHVRLYSKNKLEPIQEIFLKKVNLELELELKLELELELELELSSQEGRRQGGETRGH